MSLKSEFSINFAFPVVANVGTLKINTPQLISMLNKMKKKNPISLCKVME
jgi:hypothetical protein